MPNNLIWQAEEIRLRAYAPYSKYLVGAAISTAGGVFLGCNVEAADYDGTHAEEAALAAMVAGNCRAPLSIAVVGGLVGTPPMLVAPCGKCRQKLIEFASLSGVDLRVILTANKILGVPISKLLPYSFGPADIGISLAE